MKLVANAGTDAATIILFWPDQVPADAEQAVVDDPSELIERLQSEGKLIWFLCDGDGSYTLAVYLDTEVPPYLRAVCKDDGTIPRLNAVGPAYFAGGEYLAPRNSDRFTDGPYLCE
jgi:hypothetical protein